MSADDYSDGQCMDCGRPDVSWWIGNDIFNRVMGGPNGIICMCCFTQRAAAIGVYVTPWTSDYSLLTSSTSAHVEIRRLRKLVGDLKYELKTAHLDMRGMLMKIKSQVVKGAAGNDTTT